MLLAEAIAMVAPGIDPGLVPPDSVPRLVKAARSLPEAAVAAYIECRADPAAQRTDLLACLLSTADPLPARVSPAKRSSGATNSVGVDQAAADGGWALAEAAQRCRRTAGSALHGRSPLVWLEFDDAGRAGELSSPSVCICLEPSYLDRNRYREPASRCEEMAAAATALAGLDGAAAEAVLRGIRFLPGGGRAIHISFMKARTPATTKLYLRLPVAAAVGYLRDIGWSGDSAEVTDLFNWRRRFDSAVHLDVSLEGAEVLPRLGVAFPRDDDGEPFHRGIFEGLARRALTPGTAARAKKAALSWTATQPCLTIGDGWPNVVHRWIDQKIVFDEGTRELKLYLAVRPLPALFGAMAAAGGRG